MKYDDMDKLEELDLPITTEYFWDCECEEHYIHPKTDEKCSICNHEHHEMPDARTIEVIKMLTGEIWWAEARTRIKPYQEPQWNQSPKDKGEDK